MWEGFLTLGTQEAKPERTPRCPLPLSPVTPGLNLVHRQIAQRLVSTPALKHEAQGDPADTPEALRFTVPAATSAAREEQILSLVSVSAGARGQSKRAKEPRAL